MKNNVLIFGDSYSTFSGFVPAGQGSYYTEGPERSEGGVNHVSNTWWYKLCKEADMNLVLNDSWAGTTIGYTGYNNTDGSKSFSFIYRLRRHIENGFFKENEINTVFVFGATNDSWSNAPLGEPKFGDWEESDFYNVLPAICYFFYLLRETLPNAKIYCLVNDQLKQEISDCLVSAGEKYGATAIDFEHIDKIDGHPTDTGMTEIKDRILSFLK